MEFLRYASSIPGSYWGCCAMDVIQYFKVDPDQPYAISLVDGDGGTPIMINGKQAFLGKTYRDVFLQRMLINTFNSGLKPDHGFTGVLTASQCASGVGAKWMAILKEYGFEFIRGVSNSVYTGDYVPTQDGPCTGGAHENYMFGLFRNINPSRIKDPFAPPAGWDKLPEPYANPLTADEQKLLRSLQTKQEEARYKFQRAWWIANKGKLKFWTLEELLKEGLTESQIAMAGERSKRPQQPKSVRDKIIADEAKAKGTAGSPGLNAFKAA